MDEEFILEENYLTSEEAKKETFAFIDKQAEILREELKQIQKEYEKV